MLPSWHAIRLLFVVVGASQAYSVGEIKHFLVLFYENRAFDHIFGCATSELPGIDGVVPGMGNWVDPNNHSKGFVEVGCGDAPYVCDHDQDHSFPGMTSKIFGPGVTNGSSAPYPQARMVGFANKSLGAMQAFNPDQLPIKITLAKEFGLFNNLYASIPGPSQPNHMFAQSATSCGCTETGCKYTQCGGLLPLFPQRTIYENLLDSGHDFSVFHNGSIREGGVPGDLYMTGLLKHVWGRAKTFDEPGGLFERAATGTLPAFSWVLPRNGGSNPNDDHPCHDVALGEELLKSVYEALRAGPAWNDTALFVVYDDPGGFFDHVPTPLYAPSPDSPCDRKNCARAQGCGCPDAFQFDRLGQRLANLLISPRVPKGAVFRDPEGPTNSSKYDLASIPATVKNLFGLPNFLTKRDAWSGSFHELLLSEPRQDTPMHLPSPPSATASVHAVHGCGHPDDATRRQQRHDSLLRTILGRDDDEDDEDDEDSWWKDEEIVSLYAGSNRRAMTGARRSSISYEAMKTRVAGMTTEVLQRLADGRLTVDAMRDEL